MLAGYGKKCRGDGWTPNLKEAKNTSATRPNLKQADGTEFTMYIVAPP